MLEIQSNHGNANRPDCPNNFNPCGAAVKKSAAVTDNGVLPCCGTEVNQGAKRLNPITSRTAW